jgi:hypothetical protein
MNCWGDHRVVFGTFIVGMGFAVRCFVVTRADAVLAGLRFGTVGVVLVM